MYEIYEYGCMGVNLYMTFETREEMVRYMEEHELYAWYDEGYYGLCPDGEEITL